MAGKGRGCWGEGGGSWEFGRGWNKEERGVEFGGGWEEGCVLEEFGVFFSFFGLVAGEAFSGFVRVWYGEQCGRGGCERGK